MTIGVVINFCSNERAFLPAVLRECSKFSKHISVAYGSHMYDGVPEEVDDIVGDMRAQYPSVKFVDYKFDPAKTDMKGVIKRPTAYWCNLARWIGFEAIQDNVEYVIFIDADEIPEGDVMCRWLKNYTLSPNYTYKLSNYWYFKSVHNQATSYEDSILLVHKSHLTEKSIFHDDERDGIIKMANIPLKRNIKSHNNAPMWHHYSWVRTREGIAKKLRTSTHRDDLFKNADVESILDHMYKNEAVNDFVHNYTYIRVDNFFDVFL